MTKVKEKPKKKANKKRSEKSNKINKIRQHIVQVTLLSLIIFAVIFCTYQIIKLAINPTESFLIEQGTISQSESVTGYVIREEKVIQTPENQNKLVQIKNEGERVSVGEEVFRYEATNEEELNEKIKNLNKQIQVAMESQAEVFSSDIKALDKQIENKINGIQNNNNIQEIKEYKTDINGYITKKAKISGELSPAGSYISNLINEKIKIENQLKDSSQYEKAPIGGVVSYRVDGLEDTLTFQSLDGINKGMLESLGLITGQIVTTSDKEGKIINNFECYIAVSTKTEEAKKAEVGKKLKIKLATNQEIPATIEYIKDDNDSKLIVLKITQGVEYLTNYRKISLDIVWWEQQGLRIPNSSIIYENGLSYVIRNKAGNLSKILIKVVKENDKYSIITNYKVEELKNMGYSVEEINNIKKINIYDEILADPDIERISRELN